MVLSNVSLHYIMCIGYQNDMLRFYVNKRLMSNLNVKRSITKEMLTSLENFL